MSRRSKGQLLLPVPPTWGGYRKGAGRKPELARPGAAHDRRPAHEARHPVHVTLRAGVHIASLRTPRVFPELVRALARSNRFSLRVIQFSVQTDHVHLIVEADGPRALDRGLRGLSVRTAKAINRSLGRRGRVWGDRYHTRSLETPREVRTALAYVLLNFRKHLKASPGVDPRSSGPWFAGWKQPTPTPSPLPPTAAARTWLAQVGWQRGGGPIDCREVPGRRSP